MLTAAALALPRSRLPARGLGGSLQQWAAASMLPSLQTFDLSGNAITGTLPSSWFAAGAFPELQQLLLRNSECSSRAALCWCLCSVRPSIRALILLPLCCCRLADGHAAALDGGGRGVWR